MLDRRCLAQAKIGDSSFKNDNELFYCSLKYGLEEVTSKDFHLT